MKDYMMEWIADHTAEDEDGAQYLVDDNGHPLDDRRFPPGFEEEFDEYAWEKAMSEVFA